MAAHRITKHPIISVCILGFGCSLAVWSCKRTDFVGTDAKAKATPKPKPPEPQIKLQGIAIQPEAQWESCMFVSLSDTFPEQPIGCNRPGKFSTTQKSLPVDGKQCQKLRIKVVTKMRLGASCKPTKENDNCSKTLERTVENSSGNFKITDVTQIDKPDAIDPLVSVAPALRACFPLLRQSACIGAKFNPQTRHKGWRWIRVFFEDKPIEEIANFQKGMPLAANADGLARLRKDSGIDFNDLVFDFQAANVPFTIAGLPEGSCLLGSQIGCNDQLASAPPEQCKVTH